MINNPSATPDPAIIWWITYICMFDIEFKHVDRKLNPLPDALLRREMLVEKEVNKEEEIKSEIKRELA